MAVFKFSNPSPATETQPKKEKRNKMATKTKKPRPKKKRPAGVKSPKQRRWLAAVKRHGGPEQAKKHWDGEKGVDRTLSTTRKPKRRKGLFSKSGGPQKPKPKTRPKKTKINSRKKRIHSNPGPRFSKHSNTSEGMLIAQDVAGASAGFAVTEIAGALIKAIAKNTSGNTAVFTKMVVTAGLFMVRRKISPNQRFSNQVCIGSTINTLASAYNTFAPQHLAVLQKDVAADDRVSSASQPTDPNAYAGWNEQQQAQAAIQAAEPGLSGFRRLKGVRLGAVPKRNVLNYLPASSRMVTGGGVSTVRIGR